MKDLFDPAYERQFKVRLASGTINAPSYEARVVRAQVQVRKLQVAMARRRALKGSLFSWIGR